jgi:SDR family mycofactocin-dependent oxidoreductase
VRLAKEGADIVGFDLCRDHENVKYPMGTEEELKETQRLVEAEGKRCIAEQADVREFNEVKRVLDMGLQEFGHVDIVVPNAGISILGLLWEWSEPEFRSMLDTNLIGVWNTVRAVVPSMIQAGRGGSVIFISSSAGLKGVYSTGAYTAAKHGVIGMMRVLANELAEYEIRSNAICPGNVRTKMIDNDETTGAFLRGHEGKTTFEDAEPFFRQLHMLPIAYFEPEVISDAVVFLASDESKYVTSVALPVDGGMVQKMGGGA